MKTSKFTEAQIAFVQKQAEDGAPIAEVCRKAGLAMPTSIEVVPTLRIVG